MKKYINYIINSISIFIVMFILQCCISMAFGAFGMTAILTSSLLTCIVAPITEEYAKRYAMLNNFPFIFTTILVILETTMYTSSLLNAGYLLYDILKIRFFPAVLHFMCVNTQVHYHKKDKSKFGYWYAVLLHTIWNFCTFG